MKHTLKKHRFKFRDFFLITVGLVVLYQQVFIAAAAQPLLIFLVVFLWASAPLLRGDSTEGLNMLQRFVLQMMGISQPQNPDGTNSSGDTPPQSDSSASPSRSPSSPKS